MLFVFRGIRAFQVLLAIAALATGLGAVLTVLSVADGETLLVLPAAILGLAFFWTFSAALRAPTSFVAVAEERTRIRFAGFVDTVIANDDVVAARVTRWPIWGGIGLRTNFGGHVALTSSWGEAIELELRNPIRVAVIPGIWRVRAHRLTLSIRNPQKLADRFKGNVSPSPRETSVRKMKGRGSRTR